MLAAGLLAPCAALAAGPGPCGAAATPIHSIQGSGPSSPLRRDGGVAVEAVVVGDFQGLPDGLGGFFVQEEDADADGDPATSEGLFVFDAARSVDVHVGDLVRARGEVREYFGLTELVVEEGVVRCGRRVLPTAASIHLPLREAAEGTRVWERFEGMRVHVETELVVADAFDLARFGELDLAASERPIAPTQRAAPGPPALAAAAHDAQRRILLDDGRSVFRPDPIPYIDMIDKGVLRLGDRVHGLEGVIDFAFGRFRLQPTRRVMLERTTERCEDPPDVAGRLRVASWNVGNYFNGDGAGGGFPTRGASSPYELERQRAKLVETLARLDADIVALAEVENDGVAAGSAVDALRIALERRSPGVAMALVDPGRPRLGEQPIAVAILYRPDVVALVGTPAVLDTAAAPAFDTSRHRPGLAASFRHLSSGRTVTLVAHHWKSKGSSCAATGDPDRGDGQGRCNATRTSAARALLEWLAGDPTGAGAPPVLIVGDLNAYPQEDPVRVLREAGWIDLLERFSGSNAYTFVFDGAAGRLDHALASPGLLDAVGGAVVWHTNADELPVLDYRETNPPRHYRPDPFRASDHDPVLVGLFTDRPPRTRKRGRGRAPGMAWRAHAELDRRLGASPKRRGQPDRADRREARRGGTEQTDRLLASQPGSACRWISH